MLPAMKQAFDYLRENGVDIPLDLYLKGLKHGAIKAGGDLSAINKAYHDSITKSLTLYFEGGGSVAGPRNAFKRAMVEAFGSAFELGYTDGGGGLPFEGDALDWFNARISQELGFIDTVFEQAKLLRKDSEADWFAWATARADGYTMTLQSIYAAGRMWAKKNQMLTWHLGGTEKHCSTCASLDGKRHKATWYLSRDYIPRKPGAAMECGGYRCDCSLTNDKGEEITI